MSFLKSIGKGLKKIGKQYGRKLGGLALTYATGGVAAPLAARIAAGGSRYMTGARIATGRRAGIQSSIPGGGGVFASPDPTVSLPPSTPVEAGLRVARWGGMLDPDPWSRTMAGLSYGLGGVAGLGLYKLAGGGGAGYAGAGPSAGPGGSMETSQEGLAAVGRLLQQVVGALMSGEPDAWVKKRVSASGLSGAFRKYWPRLLTYLEAVDMPGGEEVALDLGPSDKILISNELQRLFSGKGRHHRATFLTKSGERALRMAAATVKLLRKGERAVKQVKGRFTKGGGRS